MFSLEALPVPIVQAPMAGGPSTIELAVAVAQAGGLGFLAAGYKRAAAVAEDIAALHASAPGPFGVNIFVPASERADPEAVRRFVAELAGADWAERYGVRLGDPRSDDDDWAAKLDVVCEARAPVVSFTFGCPPADTVARLQERGIAVWVTVTSAGEARQAAAAGADALVVQGFEAGGHRGGFVDAGEGVGLLALLLVVRRAVSLPLVATGGIADGAGLAAVLCAGAAAGQIGTALMLSPEAGTAAAQRALLTRELPTGLTRAFSGRLARGMINRFQAEHSASAPVAYPEIHHVTSPLRAEARRRGDADGFNLWAGQAHELVLERPAGEIVRAMASEAREAVSAAARRLRA